MSSSVPKLVTLDRMADRMLEETLRELGVKAPGATPPTTTPLNPKNVDDAVLQRHEQAKAKVEQVRNVYLYGLERISQLTDLQDAPDAIMPGNEA